ncbi:DUF4232 domain-containing protein [Actinacidiphila reveromycinica]|uniref:DUF4232 domain-containing protein n=1 Tax=Actinacidiphila reveromycinica TaxID=659352 RepID=UPI001921EE77|nr:DUF4232 domain-containing protein [Streptomyces sp. SN-593]
MTAAAATTALVALLAAGCATRTGAGADAPPDPGDFRVHADTLPPDGSGETGATPGTRPTGGATGATGGTAVTASATPTGPCPASGLRAAAGPTDGAMGLRQVQLTLTDCGSRSLTVDGYPALRLLDDDGRTVQVAVHHGDDIVDSVTDPGPAATTLRPGGHVVAVLAWRNTYTISNEPPALATVLEFTVEGAAQRAPLTVDLGNTGKIDVTAWYAGK